MSWFNKKNSTIQSHKLNSKPINDYMGVTIYNVRDITKITLEQANKIKEYIDQFYLVVIKGNRIWTENEQLSFTEKIGILDAPLTYSLPQPRLSKEKKDNRLVQSSGIFWHSDRAYNDNPSHLSVFQMTQIPLNGTETSFVSLIESYKELPKAIHKEWNHYCALYNSDAIHPLIWKHPFNGEVTIYLDLGFMTSIMNPCENGEYLTVKDSNRVISLLNETLSTQRSLYHHIWEKGDIVIVDNYAVAHKANLSLDHTHRILQRTTTKGIHF
ncbi:MAG: TauD/TfdA family dioxygenase [Bacteroidota bacterium]